jgi:hypothetical protein
MNQICTLYRSIGGHTKPLINISENKFKKKTKKNNRYMINKHTLKLTTVKRERFLRKIFPNKKNGIIKGFFVRCKRIYQEIFLK